MVNGIWTQTPRSVSRNKSGMLDALTSFRFIAALMVFIWHSHIFNGFLSQYELGYAGVGFFYMLSGFILTYVYFDKLKSKNINGIKKFYIARIAKIYPVHIMTFLVSIPLFLQSVNIMLPEHTKIKVLGIAVANLFLFQSYFPSEYLNFSFNGVAWSISVEIFFYCLFPLIILILAKRHKQLTVKRLLVTMAALWITLVILYVPQQSHIDDWKFYILPAARLPDFVIGIFLGLAYLRIEHARIAKKIIESVSFTNLEIITVALLISAIGLSPILPQSVRFSLVLMPFWAMIIFVFAFQKGQVSRFLAIRPLIFLGEISFSFYMTHLLTINYVSQLHYSVEATAFISFVCAIVASIATYVFFEEPLRLRVKHALEYGLIYRRKARLSDPNSINSAVEDIIASEQAAT